jgi:hypothetical protein
MLESKWHGQSFKHLCHGNAKDTLIRLAATVEKLAKQNIQISIYNRPQLGLYKRTGAAMSSIHWMYYDKDVYALIGSDTKSLNDARIAAGATGSKIFYFKWLEDGFHTRNGRFIPGHHMLKRALDTLKRGLR